MKGQRRINVLGWAVLLQSKEKGEEGRVMIDEGWRLEINLVELSGSSRSESNERSTRLGPARSGTCRRVHIWDLLPCTVRDKMALSARIKNASMCC